MFGLVAGAVGDEPRDGRRLGAAQRRSRPDRSRRSTCSIRGRTARSATSTWIVDARAARQAAAAHRPGRAADADLARAADFVLPGASFVEKEASYTNEQGRLQGTARAIPPPGDAMEDWQILVNLGARARRRRSTTRAPRTSAPTSPRGLPACQGSTGLTTLAFSRPVSARHWLQASNPSERWKWDFMFQDLPPVKGAVDPSALPTAAGMHPAERSEVTREASRHDTDGTVRRRAVASASCSVSSVVLASLLRASAAHAQLRRPRADVTPLVESDGVRAGATVRARAAGHAARRASHAIEQAARSDAHPDGADDRRRRPASPSTKSCSRRRSISSRRARTSRSRSSSASSPIGVRLTIAAQRRAGRPHRARRSCATRRATTTMCYAPATADVDWTLHVVPPAASARPTRIASVFGRIAFGTRRSAGRGRLGGRSGSCRRRAPAATAGASSDARQARQLHGARHDRRLSWAPPTS